MMQQAPYGSWKSPITSDLIVGETIVLGQAAFDGEAILWIESRPKEKGRHVLVRRTPDGVVADVNPQPFNARTRAHEYGGGAYLSVDGTSYYSHFADQRIYRQTPGAAPQPLTPEGAWRYADAIFDRRRNRLICIGEDHARPGQEAANAVVSISLHDGAISLLASGRDFYSSPRVSPDGRRLAWLEWNHPNMPWDGTELWVGELGAAGAIGHRACVAGGEAESIFQPEWSPSGVLHFVSDRTGWWNLYRLQDGRVQALAPMQAEFGMPQWVFGMSIYGFDGEDVVCAYTANGRWQLARIDARLQFHPIELPWNDISRVRVQTGAALAIVGSPTEASMLVRLELQSGRAEVLRRSTEVQIDAGYLSVPQPIEFPTDGGLTGHAIYYPPGNRDFEAPPGEKPPLVVMSHGGPTGAARGVLNLGIQYWTSRGLAVVDVNYGGSTGYGRAYRERLNGKWGIVDMNDCANAALHLVRQGLADPARLAITGGSAGGYTTLCALTFRSEFRAGASHFGVSDLEALAKDTHKFESRYLDRLVGPYPARRDLYLARSPIHHAGRLSCPLILFQGDEDRVVPPEQSRRMYQAARAKGLPVAYLEFAGEQHGFRQAANIKRSLDGELYFYSRIFGFELADPVEPVPIENLPAS